MLVRASTIPVVKNVPQGAADGVPMLLDDRVLFIHPDGIVYRSVAFAKPARQTPLTVVIPVHDDKFLGETLRALALQRYDDWRILIVCANPTIHASVLALAATYQPGLPKIELFVLAEAGWLSTALNAALHRVETAYWCRLDSDDLLHPAALQLVSARIQQEEPDYLYSAHFMTDRTLHVLPVIHGHPVVSEQDVWSGRRFPFSHLITYKTAAMVRLGGFRSDDHYPNDAEWIAGYSMLAAGMKFHYINGALYYKRAWKGSASSKERTSASDYRRGLVLRRWPEWYVEDYSSR